MTFLQNMIRIFWVVNLLVFITSCNDKSAGREVEIGDPDNGAVLTKEGQSLHYKEYENAANLIGENKIDEAIKVYTRLLSIEQEQANALAGLGSCYSLKNDFSNALISYRQSLVINPVSMTSLVGIGSAYSSLKEYDSAIHFYNQAKKINPEVAETYWGLAIVYDEIGDRDNAKQNAKKFIDLAPNSMYRQLMEEIIRK